MGRAATLTATLVLAACGIDVVGIASESVPDAAAPSDATVVVDSAPATASDAGGETSVADAQVDTDADAAPAKCRSDELSALGHCYFLDETNRDEPGAATACKMRGGYLVSITSQEEETWYMANANGIDRWIGLVAENNDNNQRSNFHWASGEQSSFDHWYPSDPNDKGKCVIILKGDPEWADRQCTESHPTVCERAP